MTRSKRIYVLDTNVLMHDPTALFKFQEHDVYLPMQVIAVSQASYTICQSLRVKYKSI